MIFRNRAEVGLIKSILNFIVVFVYYLVSTVYECPSPEIQAKRTTFR